MLPWSLVVFLDYYNCKMGLEDRFAEITADYFWCSLSYTNYLSTYIYAYMQTYMHTRLYIYTCTNIYTHMYVHILLFLNIDMLNLEQKKNTTLRITLSKYSQTAHYMKLTKYSFGESLVLFPSLNYIINFCILAWS